MRLSPLVRLCLLLVSFSFPEPVAGGARELARIRAALVDGQRHLLTQSPTALSVPCSQYPMQLNPCTPDFGGIEPDRKITDADIKQANMQAFINEVVKDEDSRVAAQARDSAKKAVELDEARKQAEAELQTSRDEAGAALQQAKNDAISNLSNATAAMMRDIAARAALLGQRQQLAKDQAMVKSLMEKQANSSNDAALLAAAKSLEDQMKADATASVQGELEAAAAVPSKDAISNETVAAALKLAQDEKAAAEAQLQAAVQGTADYVMTQSNLLRDLQTVSKTNMANFAEATRQLDSAYAAPKAFVDGVIKVVEPASLPLVMPPVSMPVVAVPAVPAIVKTEPGDTVN